ncbi:putative glycoside hydrolase family 15 protein [Actinosynnema sp. NPDC059797]
MSAVLGLMTAATLVAPAGSAGVEPAADASGGGQVKSFWLHMNSTPIDEKTLVTEAKRRSYVVLNAWEGDLAARFKAANPAIELFVYKDLSSTRSYACRNGVDDEHLPAGIGFCAAERDHPEWFLLDSAGRRFEYGGYSGHWQMDVGNPAYQQAWARNVVASAQEGGFDGVFMDNALFPCDAYHEGVCPAKYPTDAAIQDAYTSMLANTRDRFVAAGLKTVANLSNARLHAGAWDTYTEHLDGGFDEWWLTFDDTNLLPEYAEGWSRQVAQITANEARGKITWVQPHFSPDAERPYRYALASYLIAAGERAAFADVHRTDGYGDASPWRAEYDWDLGTPTGPHRAVARNIYQRDFACGTVLVNANPTDTAAVTVKVNGNHTDERGTTVTSVALPGTTGTILRRPC